MNVVVSIEQRFQRTPDGAVWTPAQGSHSFWSRYLAVFDSVRVVARVLDVPRAPAGWHRADGERVSFAAVPYYVGPWQYLLRSAAVKRTAAGAVGPADAVILRVASTIAGCIEPQLRRRRQPYGVEVVVDPHDVFSRGSVKHALRPFFRWWFARHLRRLCAGACAAAYVTQYALQKRYPCPNHSTWFSDVDISDGSWFLAPRAPRRTEGPFTLVSVGSLEQLYKAPDVLIDAAARCRQDGLHLRVLFAGDGKHRPELQARAVARGLGNDVVFHGRLPAGERIRAVLDQADAFVLPSRAEGLPRAMIEAMARALPCIGSTVGGIPELLPPEDMVPPGDPTALARKIREVLTDPERMARMSAHSVHKAREYSEAVLRTRRIAFYRYLKEKTEAWRIANEDHDRPDGASR